MSTVDPPAVVARRPHRRVVLWGALAALVVFCVVIALLATVHTGPIGSPDVGKPAPALAGSELGSAQDLSLASYPGRFVLVDFAASWCGPCREEMPQLAAFAAHAQANDAALLMVAYDPTDQGNLAAYLRSLHATWPTIADPDAQVAWGLSGVPDSFLVAPDRTVIEYVSSGVSAAQVDRTIAQYQATH